MAFHEVRFPLRLSLGMSGGPVRRTDIVNLSNGRESRNRRWQASRRAYDAGSGIRSLADLYQVIAFFEARAGAFAGFRLKDPMDFRSGAPEVPMTPLDQAIGTGTGTERSFQLSKTYGETRRVISKPVAGTVQVAVNGRLAGPSEVSVDAATGIVTFAANAVPPAGAVITAGFEFDVPVRFASDRLEVSLEAFQAGRIPTIPLTEIVP